MEHTEVWIIPDFEFSDRYVVFYSPSKGTLAMTNPLSIRLFFELNDEDMSVGELSKKLDVPMTSVQNSINRMYANDILVKYNDPEDSRRTVYRVNMIPMFMDSNGYDTDQCHLNDCIRDLLTYPKDLMKNVLNIFLKIMSDNGINLWPMLMNVGVFLETAPRSTLNLSNESERNKLKRYRTHHVPNVEFDISFDGDLTVTVGSDKFRRSDIVFMNIGMGLLIKRMSRYTNNFYSPMIRTEHDAEGRPVRFVSRIHSRKTDDVSIMDKYAILSTPGTNQDVFDIYRIGNRSFLIKNRLMIEILDSLHESEMDVLGLEDRTGKQKISIYSALSKLEGIGAVHACNPDSKRNKVYRIDCERMFRSRSTPLEHMERDLTGFGNPDIDTEDLCLIIYSCVEIILEKMGISMTDMMVMSFKPLKDLLQAEFGKRPYEEILNILNYKDITKVVVENKKRKLRPINSNRENRYLNNLFDYLLEDVLNS